MKAFRDAGTSRIVLFSQPFAKEIAEGKALECIDRVAQVVERRAQVDFIPADPAALRAVARKAQLNLVGPKTGFLIRGEDRVGALAELMAKRAEAQINVTACAAVAAGAGQYGAILWVKPGDVQKAARLLGATK